MSTDVAVSPGAIIYFASGRRISIHYEQLEQMITDARSWLNYTCHVMGGPPARMRVVIGGNPNPETVFVARKSLAPHGQTYEDLNSKYPET